MRINTVADFRRAVRFGPYTFPGMYDIAFITSDGAALCHACATSERRSIIDSIATKCADGWQVVAVQSTDSWECGAPCDHCGKDIGPEMETAPLTPDYSPDDHQREELARELVGAVGTAFMDSDMGGEWLDVRVTMRKRANGDGGFWWLSVGDASYDTDHGHACGASSVEIVRHLNFTDALAIVDDCVAQCLDALNQ
jgi:hypothetical protein